MNKHPFFYLAILSFTALVLWYVLLFVGHPITSFLKSKYLLLFPILWLIPALTASKVNRIESSIFVKIILIVSILGLIFTALVTSYGYALGINWKY